MTTYVALLYSVVIGGSRSLKMGDLRAMADSLGLGDPYTVVATGNLLFDLAGSDVGKVEALLEEAFTRTFERHVDIIVRKAADWPALMEANPFPDETRVDPAHVAVRVGREPVADGVIATLEPYLAGDERIAAAGRDLWMWFPHGIGTSKLASAVTPKRAGIGTARNWNTVRKIGEALEGRSSPAACAATR